jgi:hypothetical protein
VCARKLFLVALLVPVLACSGVSRAPAATKTHHLVHARKVVLKVVRVAPADEYFGRLKMSILGIRNQLRDLALRLQYAPEKSADVMGPASFVEDALHDWEHKYPSDPWLPKNVFQLTQLYAQIHTDEGQRSTSRVLQWLLARYGRTPYAAQARTQIASQVK